MLFDPKKAAVYTVENLVAWLGEQPSDQVYKFTDSRRCAATRYLIAQGISMDNGQPVSELRDLGWLDIVSGKRVGGVYEGDYEGKSTFGQAHQRGLNQLAYGICYPSRFDKIKYWVKRLF